VAVDAGAGRITVWLKIAEQFGLKVLPTRAGLVPFTLHKPLLEQLQTLSGVSVPSVITAEDGQYSVKIFFLRIAGSPALRCCKSPVTGSRASL
jgi:predicted flavoprotein YhiN